MTHLNPILLFTAVVLCAIATQLPGFYAGLCVGMAVPLALLTLTGEIYIGSDDDDDSDDGEPAHAN